MIEVLQWCDKKHFNKELVITKKDNEDFENSTKCWICNNDCIDNNVKVRDQCHITGKYRGSSNRDSNIMSYFTIWKTMIDILLCKNQANSILKSMSYQMDWKILSAFVLTASWVLLIASNF